LDVALALATAVMLIVPSLAMLAVAFPPTGVAPVPAA